MYLPIISTLIVSIQICSSGRHPGNCDVRIGSLHSFHDGIQIPVDWVQRVAAPGVEEQQMTLYLGHLATPYETRSDTNFAFVAVPLFRPQKLQPGSQNKEKFVISGWHGANDAYSWQNHIMNAMLASDKFWGCRLEDGNVTKYSNFHGRDIMACYGRLDRRESRSETFLGSWDDGAGVFKMNTNLLMAVGQGALNVANYWQRSVIATNVDHVRKRIMDVISSSATDEYDEYPEYKTDQGIF